MFELVELPHNNNKRKPLKYGCHCILYVLTSFFCIIFYINSHICIKSEAIRSVCRPQFRMLLSSPPVFSVWLLIIMETFHANIETMKMKWSTHTHTPLLEWFDPDFLIFTPRIFIRHHTKLSTNKTPTGKIAANQSTIQKLHTTKPFHIDILIRT